MKVTVYRYPLKIIPARYDTVIEPESFEEAARLSAMTDEEQKAMIRRQIDAKGVERVTL